MKLKVKEYLEKNNISVYWLKNNTGISHATIYKISNNDTSMISLKNLGKICKALNCTPNDILEFEEE